MTEEVAAADMEGADGCEGVGVEGEEVSGAEEVEYKE